MNELAVNEVASNTIGPIEVKYVRPKFVHRILANLVDLIIFIIVFLALFLAMKGIVTSTPDYKALESQINTNRIDSGMYVMRESEMIDVVSYCKSNTALTDKAKVNICKDSIDKFFIYEIDKMDDERYLKMSADYDTARLTVTADGHHLFILDGDEIIENNLPDDAEYFATHYYVYLNFYYNQIDGSFQGYFATTPIVYDLTKRLNTYLVWLEIFVAYVLGVILTYFVPTLFFARNRYTLGKALYRVGAVDSRFLHVSFGRNAAKWAIFLVEMVAGAFSFGIIFICSFTLMVFSKNKQGFPDYMLKIQEVDCSKNKIYKNYFEIELDKANKNKKPTDFKLIN